MDVNLKQAKASGRPWVLIALRGDRDGIILDCASSLTEIFAEDGFYLEDTPLYVPLSLPMGVYVVSSILGCNKGSDYPEEECDGFELYGSWTRQHFSS